MFDVVDRQIRLIAMWVSAQPQPVRMHSIGKPCSAKNGGALSVGQVGGGDRRLGGVGLGKRHFGIGVDKGLLAGSASPFERTGIEGILRVRIARVRGFDPAAVFAVLFFSSPVPQPALQ